MFCTKPMKFSVDMAQRFGLLLEHQGCQHCFTLTDKSKSTIKEKKLILVVTDNAVIYNRTLKGYHDQYLNKCDSFQLF